MYIFGRARNEAMSIFSRQEGNEVAFEPVNILNKDLWWLFEACDIDACQNIAGGIIEKVWIVLDIPEGGNSHAQCEQGGHGSFWRLTNNPPEMFVDNLLTSMTEFH